MPVAQGFTTPKLAVGNQLADERARDLADPFEVDASIANKYINLETLADRVRQRAVLCTLASRDASPRIARAELANLGVHIPVLQQAVQEADHIITYTVAGTWVCSRCHCVIPSTEWVAWLRRNPCKTYVVSPVAGGLALRLALSQGDTPAFGRTTLHPSHDSVWFEQAGAWACLTCGGWTTTRCQKLGQVCQPRTPAGESAISALIAGRLPSSLPARSRSFPSSSSCSQSSVPRARPVARSATRDPHRSPPPAPLPLHTSESDAGRRLSALRQRILAKVQPPHHTAE